AIALQALGVNARSWQGWQLPIKTSDAHASGRILDVNGEELVKRFSERKEVAVVAGFQGVYPETGRITTLGRGRSDTSAAAAAARAAAGAAAAPARRRRRSPGRGRRLPPRPGGGAPRPPARQDRVRGDAGDGLARRQGHAGSLDRARHGASGAHLRALLVRPAG